MPLTIRERARLGQARERDRYSPVPPYQYSCRSSLTAIAQVVDAARATDAEGERAMINLGNIMFRGHDAHDDMLKDGIDTVHAAVDTPSAVKTILADQGDAAPADDRGITERLRRARVGIEAAGASARGLDSGRAG